SVLNLVSKADVWRAVSQPAGPTLPVVGTIPVINGESFPTYELRTAGYQVGSPTQSWPAAARGWIDADRMTAARLLSIARGHGREPVFFLGSRNPLFNTNTIGLAGRLYYGV